MSGSIDGAVGSPSRAELRVRPPCRAHEAANSVDGAASGDVSSSKQAMDRRHFGHRLQRQDIASRKARNWVTLLAT